MKSLDEILANGHQLQVSLETLPHVLGDRLRRQRLAFAWRQADLAGRAGLSVQTIQAMETGANVSLQSFLQVLDVLGHGHDLVRLLENPNFPTMVAVDRYDALSTEASPQHRRVREKSLGSCP